MNNIMKKQETLEEAFKRMQKIKTDLDYPSFHFGTKWQAEQAKEMEEQQLKSYGEFCVAKFNGYESVSLNDEIFEQFKKN